MGDSQKQKDYASLPVFENAAVQRQKAPAFSHENRCVSGNRVGFGREVTISSFENPSRQSRMTQKHSDHNHSGNPYGRKHPYPTPLNNSQQLQHNKDNRQNRKRCQARLVLLFYYPYCFLKTSFIIFVSFGGVPVKKRRLRQ